MNAKHATSRQRALDDSTPAQELATLASQSFELARLVACNTAAPAALLKQLGSHSDATVRKWVTTNLNTPAQVLLKLAQQFPEQLLDNPILDLLFLENPNLFSDIPIGTVRSLVKRSKTPVSFIRYALEQDDEGVQLAIAQNRSTPADIIEHLKTHGLSEEVRMAATAWGQAEMTAAEAEQAFWLEVCDRIGGFSPSKKERELFMQLLHVDMAANGSVTWMEDWRKAGDLDTSDVELLQLAQSTNSLVQSEVVARKLLPRAAGLYLAANAKMVHRRKLAKVKELSPDVLTILAKVDDLAVLKAVAKHPTTPPELLGHLATHEWEEVREAVAGNPGTPHIALKHLAAETLLLVQRGLSRNNAAPIELRQTALAQLAQTTDRNIRYEVASHKQAPEMVLRNLSRDEERMVRRGVAQNPSTPAEVLKHLAENDRDDWVRACVASNRNAPPELLDYLWETGIQYARIYLAQNSSTPENVWKKLAQDKDWSVREVLGWSPNTPVELLDVLAQDRSPSVREYVAKNRRTPAKTLERLSRSKIEDMRYLVALNPKASIQTLERLARDEKKQVRETALKRLQSTGA